MVKTTRKRISLFKVAEEDAVSPELVKSSERIAERINLIVSSLDGQIDAYEWAKEPIVAAKQELEVISGLVVGDSEQALTKLLALVGIISEPKVGPAQAEGQVPVPGADAAMPAPPASGGPSPPSKEEKGKVDELNGQTGDQAKALTEILKEAPQSASTGGGAKMPTGQMSMRDIIKMAVNKSAADPPPPDTPPPATPSPVPGAPPMGGDPSSGGTTHGVDLEKIVSIIGVDGGEEMTFVRLARDVMACTAEVGKAVNIKHDDKVEKMVKGLRSTAKQVGEQSKTIVRSVNDVITAFRKLCGAIEGNDVSGSAGSLKTQLDGLKTYLETDWPNQDQLDENNTPENSEE